MNENKSMNEIEINKREQGGLGLDISQRLGLLELGPENAIVSLIDHD